MPRRPASTGTIRKLYDAVGTTLYPLFVCAVGYPHALRSFFRKNPGLFPSGRASESWTQGLRFQLERAGIDRVCSYQFPWYLPGINWWGMIVAGTKG